MPTQHQPEARSEPTGTYAKVVLSNVMLCRPCAPEQAVDWIGGISADGLGTEPYPVEGLPLQPPTIDTLYVILHPDGSIWREGSLYLYWLSAEQGRKAPTVENIAGDLCDFMNRMQEGGRDYLNFEGEQFGRPTYYYQSVMKRAIQRKSRGDSSGPGQKLSKKQPIGKSTV